MSLPVHVGGKLRVFLSRVHFSIHKGFFEERECIHQMFGQSDLHMDSLEQKEEICEKKGKKRKKKKNGRKFVFFFPHKRTLLFVAEREKGKRK